MTTVGITALIPPEIIYGAGKRACDINNYVPFCKISPQSKLCAWTACWRDLILNDSIKIDRLVVVAGGDCHNSLVDGQKVAYNKKIPTLYFFYPFEEEVEFLKAELQKLITFLGGLKQTAKDYFLRIQKLKQTSLQIDKLRVDKPISSVKIFNYLVSASDFKGDLTKFESSLANLKIVKNPNLKIKVALVGVPPIYPDFHRCLEKVGLRVVFDELPYEFIRLHGSNLDELAKNYCEYTFARDIKFRIDFLSKVFADRKIDGIIHYTQYACHHTLEDELFRQEFPYPMLTVQGDLPRKTPEQVKLRLEAFAELLARR